MQIFSGIDACSHSLCLIIDLLFSFCYRNYSFQNLHLSYDKHLGFYHVIFQKFLMHMQMQGYGFMLKSLNYCHGYLLPLKEKKSFSFRSSLLHSCKLLVEKREQVKGTQIDACMRCNGSVVDVSIFALCFHFRITCSVNFLCTSSSC